MAPSSPKLLTDRRVLVVEDEYFLADDIAAALRQLGAEVIGPVSNSEEALAEISVQTSIDIAVLDVNLGEGASYPVAEALRARNIPFVFGTGYEAAHLEAGYEDVPRWQKPFNPDALVRTLPALLTTD